MIDCGFPLIKYEQEKTPKSWGQKHGESFRNAIGELASLRRDLMLSKNSNLKNFIPSLAQEQMDSSRKYCPSLFEEMEGIAEGAQLSLEDIVILNNYTDFRDIEMPEEACSTVGFHSENGHISGQTWDMHQSAKSYICLIQYPLSQTNEHQHQAMVFSLVGCLGMMGITTQKTFVGVNNINTQNAQAALIWPFLVRKLLENTNVDQMQKTLKSAPVTSGHNYLIADKKIGEHWEVTPSLCQKVSDDRKGAAFHTNHCLNQKVQKEENKNSISATTYTRYQILQDKASQLKTKSDLITLLKSHENYPKSICTHYNTGGKDPSTTCGGGVFNHQEATLHLWRGCSIEDKNYAFRDFKITNNDFEAIMDL